ncbi:MAG: hypothetical protein JXX14_07685 [Deltaproteobacteria bacterium]|nr:hypothetical protein [Deltaproteobacteria bacterium]
MNDFIWWGSIAIYWVIFFLLILITRKSSNKYPWSILSFFAIVLALNKQFKLTSEITRFLKKDAFYNHWYVSRAELQLKTLAVIAILCIVSMVVLFVLAKRFNWSRIQQFILAVFVLLFAFSLVRSTSLHAIDAFLYRDRNGVQLNWVIEFSALSVAFLAVIAARIRKLF